MVMTHHVDCATTLPPECAAEDGPSRSGCTCPPGWPREMGTRRALLITPAAAALLGCEPGRMEWTGADSLEHSPAVAENVGIGPEDEPWQGMETAPRDASWVEVKLPDGSELIAHYAEDLSGSEQPPFRGWFKDAGRSFVEIKPPVAWRPKREAAKKPTDPPPPTEPRFGERLRQWLANDWLDIKATDDAGLRDIADAIDRDAAHQLEWQAATEENRIASALTLARQKIEQLVEELRHITEMLVDKEGSGGVEMRDVKVLDAEAFLERLGEIFGGEQRDLGQDANGVQRQLVELNGRKNASEEERMRLAGRVHELECRIAELEASHREKIRDIAIETDMNIRAARNERKEAVIQERQNIRKSMLDAVLHDENAYGKFEIVGGASLRRFLDRTIEGSK